MTGGRKASQSAFTPHRLIRIKIKNMFLKIRKLTRVEIQRAINNREWQELRTSLKGKSLREKLIELKKYYLEDKTEERYVRVVNYINALKRGGLIS